ncbi:hypothetical protein BN1708_019031, partial [Verticillium longisporum]
RSGRPRHELQPLLPRYRHRHGSCSLRGPCRIRGRDPCHHLADGQGCRRVPQLGRRARDGRPQEDGHEGPHCFFHPLGP